MPCDKPIKAAQNTANHQSLMQQALHELEAALKLAKQIDDEALIQNLTELIESLRKSLH